MSGEWIVKPIFNEDGFLIGYEKKGEAVRCRDCKWCRTYYHGENMPFSYECSKLMLSSIQSTSYCSFAEPKVPQKRCGNCKFLTYRWGKVWCDIRCENPTVDVCDKWKRSE